MKTKEEIRTFFDNKLLNNLNDFDVRKKKAFNNSIIDMILCSFGIISFFALFFIPNYFGIYLTFLIFGALGISVYFYFNMKYKISNEATKIYYEYKGNVVTNALDEIFDNVNYVPNQHISTKAIKESNIFGDFFYFDGGEDYFKCEIKDVIFQFSEISLSGDISILLPDYYKGIFGISDFNKNFNTQTLIIPKSKIPFYKNKYQRIAGIKSDFKIVYLEDSLFNQEFVVYGQDQVESRYLLTPSIIANILKFKKNINSRIVFSFAANRLNLFIINSKDLFEPPKTISYTNFEHFYKNINYFIIYSSIVEELNLNTRIWGKS